MDGEKSIAAGLWGRDDYEQMLKAMRALKKFVELIPASPGTFSCPVSLYCPKLSDNPRIKTVQFIRDNHRFCVLSLAINRWLSLVSPRSEMREALLQ